MEGQYQLQEGCLTIHLPRELDHHQASRIRAEADFLIEAYHVRRLIFDFGETEFMDSSGIGVIIGRCKSMGFAGGEVSAANMNERIQKIFVVSGLHKMMQTQQKRENGMEEENAEK